MSKHMGSSFDAFLEEEGILEEVEAEATKRVFIAQLEIEMKKQRITKSKLAARLETSRAAVDRLLDPHAPSTLKTLVRAARAVGKHLIVAFV